MAIYSNFEAMAAAIATKKAAIPAAPKFVKPQSDNLLAITQVYDTDREFYAPDWMRVKYKINKIELWNDLYTIESITIKSEYFPENIAARNSAFKKAHVGCGQRTNHSCADMIGTRYDPRQAFQSWAEYRDA